MNVQTHRPNQFSSNCNDPKLRHTTAELAEHAKASLSPSSTLLPRCPTRQTATHAFCMRSHHQLITVCIDTVCVPNTFSVQLWPDAAEVRSRWPITTKRAPQQPFHTQHLFGSSELSAPSQYATATDRTIQENLK